MSTKAQLLLDQLRDERSRRVVFVSHCPLNENTRYAGGATRPGAVAEVINELIAAGYGIHQLPCPERLAWGGVLKRHGLKSARDLVDSLKPGWTNKRLSRVRTFRG